MKRKLLLGVVIVLVLVAVFLVFSNKDVKDFLDKTILGNNSRGNENNNNFSSKEDSEFYFSQNSQGNSQGSSGPISGGQNASSCQERDITYSLLNLSQNSVCNQYEDEICIDKTVFCSVEINNRDEKDGFFEIELKFVLESESVPLEIKSSRFFLRAKESVLFEEQANFQSSGENGTANKNINCLFQTTEVPKKEVC